MNIHGGKGVIQDEEGWIHQDRPGNGDPLPLTSREGHPPLSDQSVEALRETPDIVPYLGDAGGLLDLFIGGIEPSKGNVFPDRI